jgi:uncharacterized protein (TIGR02266 family)
MSILLVDASKPLQELEKAALARFGLPVVTSAPERVGDTLRQARARLVLLSERCEDVAGLCRVVRAAPGFESVPVLLVTEDEGPEAQARARACGADAALGRPFTRARLGRRLRGYLAGGAGGVESRDNARVPVRVPLLYGVGQADVTGYLYNLSRTGLYLMGERTFARGTDLVLRLQLPNSRREFQGTGRVVWVNPVGTHGAPAPSRPPGMGIEFVSLPPHTRNLVDLLVARLVRHGHAVG